MKAIPVIAAVLLYAFVVLPAHALSDTDEEFCDAVASNVDTLYPVYEVEQTPPWVFKQEMVDRVGEVFHAEYMYSIYQTMYQTNPQSENEAYRGVYRHCVRTLSQ